MPFEPRLVGRERPIEIRDVFREMIAEEIRGGRLTSARRRRIVQYAAQLGLSATEAGRMITSCREEALSSEDVQIRNHALRLVEPAPRVFPFTWKLAIAFALALAAHAILR